MSVYLKNSWYMAGWSHELGDQLFSRRILDRPILIYRRNDGALTALEDRCPHRFAPLSRGKRVGDAIACGYHGLTFAPDGHCIHNPFSARCPSKAVVESFPVVERHEAIWVWFGDKQAANPERIPDYSFMEGENINRGYISMAAHYELLTDNLMDLSHIEFVHSGSFAGGGVIFKGKHSVTEDNGTLWSNWMMSNIDPPPWASFLPEGTKVDHWLDMRWNAPSLMALEVGIAEPGTAKSEQPGIKQAHILTPQSQQHTHYFYSVPQLPGVGDIVRDPFELEDKPMLEAIQRNMGDAEFWKGKPVLLSVDAGAVRARRLLAAKISAESVAF